MLRRGLGRRAHGHVQGATVLDAMTGIHQEPVLCLDFMSLYPS